MNHPRVVAAAMLALAPLASLAMSACGSDQKTSAVAPAKLPAGAREAFEHEPCDESGNRVEMLDTNNDGKADIRRVFDKKTQRELCRVVDLNHDGKPDLFEYFDASGAVRRREFCYDDTGMVNAIERYEAGRLTEREYDTTGLHKIDTWDYFDAGLPIDAKTGRPAHPSRRERDTTGNGRVDQWWSWQGSKVTIDRDTNGDGKPDPSSAVVLDQGGASAAGPSDGDAGPAAPSASDAAVADGGTSPASTDAGAATPASSSSAAVPPASGTKRGGKR